MTSSMTAAEAAEHLRTIGDYEGVRSRRASGLTWIIWGFCMAGLTVTVGALSETANLLYRHAGAHAWGPSDESFLAAVSLWTLAGFVGSRAVRRAFREGSGVVVRDRWTWIAAAILLVVGFVITASIPEMGRWEGGDGNVGFVVIPIGICGMAFAFVEGRRMERYNWASFLATLIVASAGVAMLLWLPTGQTDGAAASAGYIGAAIIGVSYGAAGWWTSRAE